MPGPSGDCLPYLAPQKSLKQICQLITDYIDINMQRCQEDLGYCLTSLAMKKFCTGCYHHGDGRKRHKMTHTISCINIDDFYTTKPFQANYFFPCDSILFFIPHHHSKWNLLNTRKCLEGENAVSVWQAYSPRRASHLLSDQLLKTHSSSERLPFAPVLKLKFKGKAPVECD